jgi:hypothetical protein
LNSIKGFVDEIKSLKKEVVVVGFWNGDYKDVGKN